MRNSKHFKDDNVPTSTRIKVKTEAVSPVKLPYNEDLISLNQTHTDIVSMNSLHNSKEASEDGKKLMEPIYTWLFETPIKKSSKRNNRSNRQSNLITTISKHVNQDHSYDQEKEIYNEDANNPSNVIDKNTSPSLPNIHRTIIKEIKIK